jgi:hypothetical protein
MEVRYMSKAPGDFFFPEEDKPYGLSYGQWTAKWWEWCFSSPMSTNPLTDDTGEYSHFNQSGPVWFLCGTFGENKFPNRNCKIPRGKGILFPVINYIFVLDSDIRTDYEVTQHVKRDIDDIVKLEATIDDWAVPAFRVASDPLIFHINIREENKLGFPVGVNRASADGYWIFLRSLPPGEHRLFFHGSCSGGIRNATASYELFIS